MINKLKSKIINKEISKYLFWKLKEFFKNPYNETKLNYYKFQLNNSDNNFQAYVELKFKILKIYKSDINEHLETLSTYASTVDTIFETGVRGVVSSWAFLHGLSKNNLNKKSLFLNDIESCDINEISKVADNLNIELQYQWENNLELKVNHNYDLVFIDTWHVYAQLKRELEKFAPISNKYIILHDTTLDGELGETIRNGWDSKKQSEATGYSIEEIEKGLWPAVEEFLENNINWVLEKRYTNCNGLTILRKIDILE